MHVKISKSLSGSTLQMWVAETTNNIPQELFLCEATDTDQAHFVRIADALDISLYPAMSSISSASIGSYVRLPSVTVTFPTTTIRANVLTLLTSVSSQVALLISEYELLNSGSPTSEAFFDGTVSHFAYTHDGDRHVHAVFSIAEPWFVVEKTSGFTQFLRVATLDDLNDLGVDEASGTTRTATITLLFKSTAASGITSEDIPKAILDDLTSLQTDNTSLTALLAADIEATSTVSDDATLPTANGILRFADRKHLGRSDLAEADSVRRFIYSHASVPGHGREPFFPELNAE